MALLGYFLALKKCECSNQQLQQPRQMIKIKEKKSRKNIHTHMQQKIYDGVERKNKINNAGTIIY
jgi:hypothetical protein